MGSSCLERMDNQVQLMIAFNVIDSLREKGERFFSYLVPDPASFATAASPVDNEPNLRTSKEWEPEGRSVSSWNCDSIIDSKRAVGCRSERGRWRVGSFYLFGLHRGYKGMLEQSKTENKKWHREMN